MKPGEWKVAKGIDNCLYRFRDEAEGNAIANIQICYTEGKEVYAKNIEAFCEMLNRGDVEVEVIDLDILQVLDKISTALWEAYRAVIEYFCGIELNFSRENGCWGICTNDEEFLVKERCGNDERERADGEGH